MVCFLISLSSVSYVRVWFNLALPGLYKSPLNTSRHIRDSISSTFLQELPPGGLLSCLSLDWLHPDLPQGHHPGPCPSSAGAPLTQLPFPSPVFSLLGLFYVGEALCSFLRKMYTGGKIWGPCAPKNVFCHTLKFDCLAGYRILLLKYFFLQIEDITLLPLVSDPLYIGCRWMDVVFSWRAIPGDFKCLWSNAL